MQADGCTGEPGPEAELLRVRITLGRLPERHAQLLAAAFRKASKNRPAARHVGSKGSRTRPNRRFHQLKPRVS